MEKPASVEIEGAKLILGISEDFIDRVGPLEIEGRNEADDAGAVVGRDVIDTVGSFDATVGSLVDAEGAFVGDLEGD